MGGNPQPKCCHPSQRAARSQECGDGDVKADEKP